MEFINPDKLRDELASAIALIDLDMSKEGTTSNIIDRSGRSILSLLMSVLENSKEEFFADHLVQEIKDLKEELLRVKIETASLKKRFNLA